MSRSLKKGPFIEPKLLQRVEAMNAKGEKKGDEWVVTFTRKLAGGEGDIAMAAGKTYNIGFAIHDDHTSGRFHHVSLGYTLGIDAKADITAAKQ